MKKIAILLTLSMMLAGCTELAEDTTESSVLTNQDLDGVYHGMLVSLRVSMNADDTFEIYGLELEECFDTNAEAQEAIDYENAQLADEDGDSADNIASEYTLVIIDDVCVASEFSFDDNEEIIYEAELGISGLTPTLSLDISESHSSHFVCDDGEEIPADWVNDDYDDCEGGEDEAEGAEDDIEGDEGELMCMHLSPTGVYGLLMDAVEILEDEDDFDAEDVSTIPASVTALFATHEANYALSPVSSMAEGCEDTSFIEGVLFGYIWSSSLAEGNTDGDFTMYDFTVSETGYSGTTAGGEAIVYVALDSGDDLSWSIVIVQLSTDGGAYVECTNPPETVGTNCAVSDNDDGKWGFSEEITISEGSDDLCGAGTCDVQVKILDRSTNKLIYESNVMTV